MDAPTLDRLKNHATPLCFYLLARSRLFDKRTYHSLHERVVALTERRSCDIGRLLVSNSKLRLYCPNERRELSSNDKDSTRPDAETEG